MIVEQFYHKNQFTIKHFGGVTFQSYKTEIATITNNGDLFINFDFWDYSQTTLKHLYLFLRDYAHKITGELHDQIIALDQAKNKKQFLKNLIENGDTYHIGNM
jgi:hypothetical protein